MGHSRLLIVSPVYCEGDHLDRTARAVASQTRPPDRWVIVDDGSSDDTLEIARRWERELPFVMVVTTATRAGSADHLARARDARAFNLGLEAGRWREFSHVGKLDGDIELPRQWFGSLLAACESDPRLGIAGGRLIESRAGADELIPIPASHVHGAVKLYSRTCFEAIGGVPERLGWDTIDETYARMHGFRTVSLPTLVARHNRPWASGQGRLRGLARHGDAAWILHQPAWWALLRGCKLARNHPRGLTGAAFLMGYARSAGRNAPRVDDPEFRRFVRAELRRRVVRSPIDRCVRGRTTVPVTRLEHST